MTVTRSVVLDVGVLVVASCLFSNVRPSLGLSPLPSGIGQYEVSAGMRADPLASVRATSVRALGAARANNVKLCEIEFPPFLGTKNEFAPVDNVQTLDANRDWGMEFAAEVERAQGLGASLWLAFADRRELELAEAAWPGQAFKAATLTTLEDAATALAPGGETAVAQPWGARLGRLVESLVAEDGALLGAKPAGMADAPRPSLVLAIQPGDGGPLEDWLNLEQCEQTTSSSDDDDDDDDRDSHERCLVSVNGAFDKLRGGYYPPVFFPKLAACVDRFIARFEPIFYLKAISDKGRTGWLYRVYPEPWQVLAQAPTGETDLVLESPRRPSYNDAISALLRWTPATPASRRAPPT